MDAFSQLIALAHVRGSMDLRCLMAGTFAMDHERLPAGEAPFHVVLAGHALMKLRNGQLLDMQPGDFVLLPRGSAHLVRDADAQSNAGPVRVNLEGPIPVRSNTEGVADLDLLCGRFAYEPRSGELIMGALPDAVHVSLAHADGIDLLRAIVELLRTEVLQLRPGALAIINAMSQALFVLVLRAYAEREDMPASLLAVLADARLNRSLLAMLRHPEKPWTLVSLAEQASMSRATFARHFATVSGQSPWAMLTTLRMQIACELLASETLPSADIAERAGYRSESAFIKVFSRHTGVTPANFRRQHSR